MEKQYKLILKCLFCFLIGNQIVHRYLNPLKGIEELAQEKKSKLWADYLSARNLKEEKQEQSLK